MSDSFRGSRRPFLEAPNISLSSVISWPGNVRQLEQALLAAMALCEGDEIVAGNFPPWFHKAVTQETEQPVTYRSVSHQASLGLGQEKAQRFLENEEGTRYVEALHSTKYPGTGRWNVSTAARQLGIPRETLVYHLKKLRLFR